MARFRQRSRRGGHLPRAGTGGPARWALVVAVMLALVALPLGGPMGPIAPAAATPEAMATTGPFQRFTPLELGHGEDVLRSAVIDPAGRYAYFATDASPSRVVKIDLRAFTRVGAIELPDGPLRAAVIDPTGRYAYFGGQGRVVKIDLQSFTGVDVLPTPDVSSAVMDPAGRYAYFGTHTAPGQVVKIDLRTFTRVGALTLRAGEDRLATAVIDPAGRYAYFGTVGVARKEPARIVKIDLTSFSRVAAIALTIYNDPEDDRDINEYSLGTAVIDPAGRYAYFGTDIGMDAVFRIDLTTFTRAGSLFVTGKVLRSAAIDPTGRFAYFGTDEYSRIDPAQLIRIDLATFERVWRTYPSLGGNSLISAVMDPAGRFAYFGTTQGVPDSPGGRRVMRVEFSPEALPALEARLATSYTTPGGWAAHLAADVDGDGRADLLSYHPKLGRWWLSTGRADGTFDPPRLAATYATTDGWQTHLAADVDGDGRADLLSYHPKRGRWWLNRGRPDGTFDPPKLATTYATTDGWQTHLAADMDGDGRADLLSYHPKNDRWSVSAGRADGTFDAPRRFTVYDDYAPAGQPTQLTADVNADGKADLLAYDPAKGRWVVFDRGISRAPWLGVRSRSTTMTWIHGTGWAAILYGTRTGWEAHLAADVTGDGRADVLSYHPARGRWSITTSRDDAWFDEPRTLTTYGTTTGWQTHLAADVTGDGRAELLSYHPARGRWWVTTPTGKR
jgi:hypothetical protein